MCLLVQNIVEALLKLQKIYIGTYGRDRCTQEQ